MEWITDPEIWIAFATLAALEIVLGIDNIIFISILVGRLPEKQRDSARRLGLGLAMVARILLLFSISWVLNLQNPLFSVLGRAVSGKDIILIGGGLFLLAKSTHEIHNSMEGLEEGAVTVAAAGFGAVLLQIMVLDIVFSLDSVITAVGLVKQLPVMVAAIVAAVGVMLFAAKAIGQFVDANPTIKILALSFLILVGVTLIADGFGVHVPKGYIYFSMAFSMSVEMINMRMRKKRAKALKLHKTLQVAPEGAPAS